MFKIYFKYIDMPCSSSSLFKHSIWYHN